MSDPTSSADGAVGTRWPELFVALLMLAVAALVIADSLRVGIAWAEDGPKAGYFPFYIGVLLALSSGWVIVGQLKRWRADDPEFAERSQLARVVAILVPTVIYVVLISLIGLYFASAILIAYFMKRYGKYGAAPVGAVAVGVPLVFFVVFEKWFLVPLPKGPIERLLGM
jgi:putative tricarboxylic transport membrane protein